MSPLDGRGRRAGLVGAAFGALATGAAVGLAAQRYAVGRSLRDRDAGSDESLGGLHGPGREVLASDGVGLHVEVDQARRRGEVPATVVFCHGYALTMDCWHYQRRDLAGLGRLVFWDQRGHGRSGRGSGEHMSIDRLGDDLFRVLEEVAPDGPLVLVGHSMGGMTVMALAETHPELFDGRIVGVALLATSPGRLAEVTLGVPARAGRALRRIAPGALHALGRQPQLVELGWRVGSELGLLLTRRYAFASDVPDSLVRFTADMIASTPVEVIAELYPAFDAHDKLAALDVLNGVETLVLVGADDRMTPPDHSRGIVESVPGAELVIVAQAGHLVQLEHPDLVNRHLRALVERALRGWGSVPA